MKYSAPVTSRITAGTIHQADGELNKGKYTCNLWSDNSSFGMCLVFTAIYNFISIEVEVYNLIIYLSSRS